jgi:DNA-binding winged helix-turn-helix (wHTH) protein/TolB-like protein/Tfp pilus assembly protein PilF
MSDPATCVYEFGPFRLDAAEGQLWRDGEEIQLTQKSFKVLTLLVENGGHVIDKNELMEKVWPDAFVEENRLADNISTLRKLLGDDPRSPSYIRTVPGRGYRFVADVREVRDEAVAMVEQTKTHIVIEEEREAPSIVPDSIKTLPDRAVPTALPAANVARVRRRRLSPTAIVLACMLLAGLAFALYYSLNRSTGQPVNPAGLLAKSIAVLPFKPLVASASDPGLELGMTDAIITRLSNIRHMTVRPTKSVLKYAGEGEDLRAIGSELGVDVLLSGRVQRVDDRIRLSVQLVRTGNGATVWADKFDEKFTDIFAVQDVISERVASALALKLTGEEKKGLAKRYTDNLQAYDLYLKGHQHWSTFTRAGREASINYYNEALKIDPGYALAYTGLANSYTVIGIYGPLSPAEAMSKAQGAVRKALELDPELGQAHVAAGALKMFYERDWPGAERELKRAMELNPNDADAHNLYGYYLHAAGNFEESITSMRRAIQLAPQWHVPEVDLLESLFYARHYDDAIEQSRQRIRLEPNSGHAYYNLGRSLTQKGLYSEAVAEFQRGINYPGMGEHMKGRLMAELGYSYAVSGNREKAVRMLEQLKEKSNPWRPMQFAKIYAGLGDKDQAFAWLAKAVNEQFPFAFDVKAEPHFDPLRADPRYAELLRRMNLAP